MGLLSSSLRPRTIAKATLGCRTPPWLGSVFEFAFKVMNFVFKMMDFVFKMMNFGRAGADNLCK